MTFDRKAKLKLCLKQFLSVSDLLASELEHGNHDVGIPLVINAAFAAELALKHWIELHTGESAKKEHNLNCLWENLDQKTKDIVASLVCAKLSISESDFYWYLDTCSSTFVDWRYMYEKEENFTNYLFLIGLAKAISDNT